MKDVFINKERSVKHNLKGEIHMFKDIKEVQEFLSEKSGMLKVLTNTINEIQEENKQLKEDKASLESRINDLEKAYLTEKESIQHANPLKKMMSKIKNIKK